MPKKESHPNPHPNSRNDCYFCHAAIDTETHHIVPRRMGGSDEAENKVILCSVCHYKLETLYDKRFYEQLGITDEKGERRYHLPCITQDCDAIADYKYAGHMRCHNCAVRLSRDDEPQLRSVQVDEQKRVEEKLLSRIEAGELKREVDL